MNTDNNIICLLMNNINNNPIQMIKLNFVLKKVLFKYLSQDKYFFIFKHVITPC